MIRLIWNLFTLAFVTCGAAWMIALAQTLAQGAGR